MKKCAIENCEKRAIRDLRMCEVHAKQKRRCTATVIERDEDGNEIARRQCKKAASAGYLRCPSHGANQLKKTVQATKALTTMERFSKPYDGPLDPVSAFELEFRRTYGRIIWLESQIGALDDEKDLIWGLTKEEHVNAAEYAGVNRTYEARVHVFEEMLRWERKHFLELEKVWINAGLEEKKLNLMRDHVVYTYNKVIEAAKLFGLDPTQPEVRDKLQSLFASERTPLPIV